MPDVPFDVTDNALPHVSTFHTIEDFEVWIARTLKNISLMSDEANVVNMTSKYLHPQNSGLEEAR